jgi:hypothetical protein
MNPTLGWTVSRPTQRHIKTLTPAQLRERIADLRDESGKITDSMMSCHSPYLQDARGALMVERAKVEAELEACQSEVMMRVMDAQHARQEAGQ